MRSESRLQAKCTESNTDLNWINWTELNFDWTIPIHFLIPANRANHGFYSNPDSVSVKGTSSVQTGKIHWIKHRYAESVSEERILMEAMMEGFIDWVKGTGMNHELLKGVIDSKTDSYSNVFAVVVDCCLICETE